MRVKRWTVGIALAAMAVLLTPSPADAQATMFVIDNKVGIGTDTPAEKLHVKDGDLKVEQTGAGVAAVINFNTAGGSWQIFQNGTTGRLVYLSPGNNAGAMKFDPQAQTNLLKVGTTAPDQVDITGNLVVSGTITPDFVFEPDFQLESIEEHANYMWTNKHLAAVGAAVVDENGDHRVNVGNRAQATLEELEKAHIYIQQLNERLKELEARLGTTDQAAR
jgi:hypothetical protein